MTNILNGLRVLLVEDEMLVCLDIEYMLESFGCRIVGPAAKTGKALALIEEKQIDVAVLDVNLGQESSHPIANHLTLLDIPFLLSTGYAEIEPPYDKSPRIQKPFSSDQLRDCLERLCTETLQKQSGMDDGHLQP